MKTLLALYTAAAREYLRDRMSLFLTLLLPLLMAGFFGLIFAKEPAYHLNLGLVMADAGPAGARIAAALQGPGAAEHLQVHTGTRTDLVARLQTGKLDVVLVLPQDLSAGLGSGRPVQAEALYDPARQAAASPGLAMLQTLLADMNHQLQGTAPLLKLTTSPVASRNIPMAQLYIPGMLSLAILWLGVFGTAPPLVLLRETQVLRRLAATPVSRPAFLGAQVGWRLTTGLLQAGVLVGFGIATYRMSVVHWPLTVAAVLLGALVFITLGFVLAGLARSNESVVALGQVVQFPMMFLSGAFMPVDTLPDLLRPVARALPLTYLDDALKQTMLGTAPLNPLWLDFAVLGGFLLALGALAIRQFRWE